MRLGIAGAQHFHVNEMLDAARRVPGLEIVGLAESDAAIRSGIADKYGIPQFSGFEELVSQAKPDVVGCFDVPSQRASAIVACLERGISVLSDKPPAVSVDALEAIRKALRRATYPKGVRPVFSVILSERYNPPVVTLKSVLESGEIGDVVNFTSFRPHKLRKAQRPDWMFRRATYGGILVDAAIHDVDVFHWLTGARPVQIDAYSSNHTCPEYPEFDDCGQMMFRADNGIVGLVKVEWLQPEAHPAHGDCRVFVTGTRGTVEVKTQGDLAAKGGRVIVCTGTRPPTEVPMVMPAGDLFADFFWAVLEAGRGGNSDFPSIPAADALDAMRVVLAAREAADTGRRMELQWGGE